MLTATTTKPGDKYRSIQHPRVYRALRRRGYSKESAARISNAQAPGHRVKADDATTVKDANWHAAHGETIQGALKRGNDGTFTSGSSASTALPKPKPPAKPQKRRAHKPKKGRAAKPHKAAKPKLTPEQRQQQRDAAATARRLAVAQQRLAVRLRARDAIRESAITTLAKNDTMNPGAAKALLKLADGKGEDAAYTDSLITHGLMERGEDGKPRLSASGHAVVGALNRGDAQGAAAHVHTSSATHKVAGPSLFTVFKDTNGAYRWLAQTTTAFEDRDNEVISLKSLAADATRMDSDKLYGPLRWWHIGNPNALDAVAPWGPGLDLGWCDFNAVSGKTLIESGTFKTEAIAQWAAANAETLGLSPGFFHPPTEPDQDGVFHHIRRFERSLAPKGRVSNLFTAFAVTRHRTHKEYTPVDPAKISQLLDMGFDQATLKALLANVTQTEKTAEAAGVRFKETAPVANPMLDQLSALETQIAALKATMAAPPTAATTTDEEAKAADDATTQLQEPADDAAAEDTDEDAAEDQAFMDAISAMLDAKLAPVLAALDIQGKVEKMVSGLQGELKAMAGGTATATKTLAIQSQEVVNEITSLKARLAELESGQTNLQRGHIASQAASTITEKAADLAVQSQLVPLSPIEQDLEWASRVAQFAAGFGPPA